MNIPERKAPDFYPIALGVMKASLENLISCVEQSLISEEIMKEYHLNKLKSAVQYAKDNLDRLKLK